jgi:glutamate:gamma-aminobutyrate antiporter
MAKSNDAQLSLLQFFSIPAVMIVAIYEYPVFATSGFSSIFYLLLGGIFWFAPIALCAAEMATVNGWKNGGVFSWVSNTLGEKWGFAAVFFQWFQVTIGFVTVLYFAVGSLSYLIQWPPLNNNPLYKFLASLFLFWFLTFLQFKGTKWTAKFTSWGLTFGILIPVFFLFLLTFFYIYRGNPIYINFSWKTFFPDFKNIDSLAILVSFMLSYTGIEASAPLINNLKNPNRNYPIVMFMLILYALILNSLGSLSLAVVTPISKMNWSAGVNETFETLILPYGKHLLWIVKILSAAMALGIMSDVSAWIISPTAGMQITAEKGIIPLCFTKTNSSGVPTTLLIFQGFVVTIWLAILTLGGGGNALSFMAALALTVVVYLVTYILMFLGYLVLIYKYSNLPRGYEVPGGNRFKIIVAGSGLTMALITFVISFFPPTNVVDKKGYILLLIIASTITLILPLLIYRFKNLWRKE